MHYLLRSLLVLNLWSIQGVYGRALSEPTQPSHLADCGQPLRTTHIVESPDFRNIAKRDETDVPTAFHVTVAPDKTCGFISGSRYNPVTCMNSSHQCAWESDEIKAVMCGAVLEKTYENWEVYIECYERDHVLNTQLCDKSCQSDEVILRCTNRSAPYCKTYAYPEGVKDYRCAPTRALQSVSFTVDTERAAQFITATVAQSVTETVPLTVESATETETSNTFIETGTEPVTTTIPEPSKTIPPPPFPSSKPDSNLGAIISGAVGGFAALLLIVLAIFWSVRRLKSDDTPGRAGSIKTHEMSGEPSHYEMSGEPATSQA